MHLRLRTRDVQSGETPEAPIPPRIEFELVHLDFPDGLACPSCQRSAVRFRRLYGGELVCPACGGSFEHGKKRRR